MSFNIPSYSDLVLEQLDIINLPTDRDWVIQGGPGTGKTVMAIFRAQQLSKAKKTVILVYNRPLKLFLENAVQETNCEVKTYNEWIKDVYSDYLGEKHFPHVTGSNFTPDYIQVEEDLKNQPVRFDHTIIDEAQDCPVELIRTVKRLSKNITCFIDPNQEIIRNKTNSTQLLKEICVEAPYLLTRNFRNTKQVRNASAVFCQEGRPARAIFNGNKPTMVKCSGFETQTDYICEFCMNNRESTIGIIVDRNKLDKIYESLFERLSSIMPVQMFKNNTDYRDFDFSESGVQIFSYGTMKGLEFDHVILPNVHYVYRNDDDRQNYNKLYVAASRPRKDLKMIYFDKTPRSKWINVFSKIDPHEDLFDWEEYK